MKQFFLLFGAIFLLSCEGETLVDVAPKANDAIEGQWVLDRVACYCAFDWDYDFSQTQFDFNDNGTTLEITNTGEYEFIAPSGTYEYTYVDGVFSLEGFERTYTVTINENQLLLVYDDVPEISDDEVNYTFIPAP